MQLGRSLTTHSPSPPVAAPTIRRYCPTVSHRCPSLVHVSGTTVEGLWGPWPVGTPEGHADPHLRATTRLYNLYIIYNPEYIYIYIYIYETQESIPSTPSLRERKSLAIMNHATRCHQQMGTAYICKIYIMIDTGNIMLPSGTLVFPNSHINS